MSDDPTYLASLSPSRGLRKAGFPSVTAVPHAARRASWRVGKRRRSFMIASPIPGGAMAETRKIAAILVADVVGY